LQPHAAVARLNFCNGYLLSVHDDQFESWIFQMRLGFIWMDKWIHKITDTGAQEIHILYTNFPLHDVKARLWSTRLQGRLLAPCFMQKQLIQWDM
jgi:hypothetical protein